MQRLIFVAIAALTAAPAHAEIMVDAFAGRAAPQSRGATIRADRAVIDGQLVPADLRIDVERLRARRSTIYGARLGYWFGAVGLAVDAATIDPDIRRQTIRATGNLRLDDEVFGERVAITPGSRVAVAIPRIGVPTTATLTPLAMVRLPRGRVQPYAFAGPTFLVTDTDLSGDWGLRAGGGVRIAITRTLGIFGEYRFTRVDATAVAGRISGTVGGADADSGDIRVGFRLRNHAAVGGVGLRF